MTSSQLPDIRQIRQKHPLMVWNIAEVEIRLADCKSIASEEQEIHVLAERANQYLDITCSHRPWITKLLKNPGVRPTLLYVNREGLILSVNATMSAKALTIRKVKQ